MTERTYAANYERPLFEERGIAAATPAAASAAHQPPSSSTSGSGASDSSSSSSGTWPGRIWRTRTPAAVVEFFGQAHAVLFLFDPLRVRDISDQLLDLVPPTNLIGGDPGDVLRKVMALIGHGNPKIGLVLSKFDALQALSKVEQSSGAGDGQPGRRVQPRSRLIPAEYNEHDGDLLYPRW